MLSYSKNSNYILRTCLAALVGALLFIVVLSFSPAAQAQVGSCEFGGDGWNVDIQPNGDRGTFNPTNPIKTDLIVKLVGDCSNHHLGVQIDQIQGTNQTVYNGQIELSGIAPRVEQTFTLGVNSCQVENTAYECEFEWYVTLFDKQDPSDASDDVEIDDDQTDEIYFEAPLGSSNNMPITASAPTLQQQEDEVECRLLNFDAFLIDPDTGNTTPLNPGVQVGGFYSDAEPPRIRVKTIFENCARIAERPAFGWYHNESFNLGNYISTEPVGPRIGITAIRDRVLVESDYILGDEGCETPNNKCRLLFFAADQVGYWFSKGRWVNDPTRFGLTEANKWWREFDDQTEDAYITYDCDVDCDTPWGGSTHQKFLCLNEDCTQVEPIAVAENQFLAGYLKSIQDSPCYIPPQNPNDPSDLGTLKPDCYDLLAPLPGLEALGVPAEMASADGRFTTQFTLGIWVNRIVTFIIGLIGLAAVVMIIVAGAQYMTTEAIGQKSDAKDRITQALIGLVIALGIFVILRTINPYLLNIDPDIGEATLEFTYDDAFPTEVAINPSTGEADYSACANNGPTLPDPTGCVNCQTLDPGTYPMKPELASQPSNRRQVAGSYKTRLDTLIGKITTYNQTADTPLSLVFTELYEPKEPRHCAQCHYNGLCTDVAFRVNGQTIINAGVPIETVASMIDAFYTMAKESNLTPDYEALGERCQNIKAALQGMGSSARIKCFTSHISGDHFSLYGDR